MKKNFSITTFFLLLTFILNAQQLNLKNKTFIKSFKNQTFNLKELQPASSKYWQLIAGQCTDRKINEDDSLFKKIIDSIKCKYVHENVISLYNDSIEILRKQIAYYECMKNHDFCVGKFNSCDSLKPAIRDWGYVGATGVSESFDAQIQNKRYNYAYKVDYFYTSSSKFGKPASLVNYCITKGWATWCPPDYCDWFILSYQNSNPTIVNNNPSLIEFLGKIDNINKAYLLVCAMNFGDSQPYPTDGSKFIYTKVGTTFYLIQNLRLSDCPIRNYSCLISVTSKGDVKIIDKIQVGEDGGCI